MSSPYTDAESLVRVLGAGGWALVARLELGEDLVRDLIWPALWALLAAVQRTCLSQAHTALSCLSSRGRAARARAGDVPLRLFTPCGVERSTGRARLAGGAHVRVAWPPHVRISAWPCPCQTPSPQLLGVLFVLAGAESGLAARVNSLLHAGHCRLVRERGRQPGECPRRKGHRGGLSARAAALQQLHGAHRGAPPLPGARARRHCD